MFILGKSAERIDEDHDGEMWRLDVDDGGVDARETETWERSDDGNVVTMRERSDDGNVVTMGTKYRSGT